MTDRSAPDWSSRTSPYSAAPSGDDTLSRSSGGSDRRKLQRSTSQRLIFGVCGGVAEYFHTDPNFVRIGVVVGTLFPPTSALVIVAYILLAVILPRDIEAEMSPMDQVQHNIKGMGDDLSRFFNSIRSAFGFGPKSEAPPTTLDSSFATEPTSTIKPGAPVPSVSNATDDSADRPEIKKAA
jgi:phage shock protein PspC (stress-responsive transcriptional regulator)